MPLNSVVRQLVFSETGRSVETTIVDGRIVMRDRKLTTVDEGAFRAELEDIMPTFCQDFEIIRRSNASAIPYLLEANRRLADEDFGVNRFPFTNRQG
jgi:5-methylthioadenosine/S-adenosylhomocysteine deaminase